MTPRRRWTLIGAALAATLGLVAWLGDGEENGGVVEPAERPAAGAGKAAPARSAESLPVPSLRAGRGGPGTGGGEVRDLFAKQTWHVPPPPPAPGPPEPPPLPFTYIGRMVDNGRVTVYLEDEEERNLAVRQGDVINGAYRVKRITPAAVTFVYIPMNKQQVLEIGSPR